METKFWSVQFYTSAAYDRNALKSELGCSQRRCGYFAEEMLFLTLPVFEPRFLDRLVTIG